MRHKMQFVCLAS